jgi:hypothetical protein
MKIKTMELQQFYSMATTGFNPEFERKYWALINRPHIMEALRNSKNLESFLRKIE